MKSTVPTGARPSGAVISTLSDERMKKRIIITAIVCGFVHMILAVGSVIVSFGFEMDRFDTADLEPSAVVSIAGPLSDVLMQPGMSLWTPWMSENMPDFLEWIVIVMNSLLWGIAIALSVHVPLLLKLKDQTTTE